MIKHYGEISGVPIISENMFLPDYLFNQICYQLVLVKLFGHVFPKNFRRNFRKKIS